MKVRAFPIDDSTTPYELELQDSDRGSFWKWVSGLPQELQKPDAQFWFETATMHYDMVVCELIEPHGVLRNEQGALLCQFNGMYNRKAAAQIKFPKETS